MVSTGVSWTDDEQINILQKTKKQNCMNYVLERISTVSACDVLLAGAQKKKQIIERRRRNLGESLDTFRKRLDQLGQESTEVQSTLAAFTAAYHALPEGRDKVDMNVKVKRLELQQAVLEKRARTYNVGALLDKELQYNSLDSQVSALEDYIVAIAQRRAALDTAVLYVSPVLTLLREPVVKQALRSRTIFPKHFFLQTGEPERYSRLVGQG